MSVVGKAQFFAAIGLAGGCMALALSEKPATATARPLATGVSGLDDHSALSFRRTRQAGATFVHIWISMAEIGPDAEPGSWQPDDPADPHYNWSRLDSQVREAVNAGLVPVLGVYSMPAWAQGCLSPGFAWRAPCDPDPTKLAQFVHAVAMRFSGRYAGLPRVRYWQILNEPNLSMFFYPQFEAGRAVSASLYRRLLNAAYVAVKSARRSNLVLAAGLGPIAVPRFTIGPMRFTRELLCMVGRRHPRPDRTACHGGVHFDIFDIHPYTTGGPTHKGRVDDVQMGDLGKLRELLRAADRAGRIKGAFARTPVWITEFSWDSKPPDPGGVPMPLLSRWTAETLFTSWRAGISRFFWFSLRDPVPTPGRPFSETVESGLYWRGASVAADRAKPHVRAFRFPFVAYSRKRGFFFWGRTPNNTRGRVAIEVRRDGSWRPATVARADENGIFDGVTSGGYGRRWRGVVRARYRGQMAVPFSLRPVKDFYQAPFGNPVE